MKKTRQEIIIERLLQSGCVEEVSRSKKYRQFKKPGQKNDYYFVGKNGALRTGKNISGSISLANILNWKSNAIRRQTILP